MNIAKSKHPAMSSVPVKKDMKPKAPVQLPSRQWSTDTLAAGVGKMDDLTAVKLIQEGLPDSSQDLRQMVQDFDATCPAS